MTDHIYAKVYGANAGLKCHVHIQCTKLLTNYSNLGIAGQRCRLKYTYTCDKIIMPFVLPQINSLFLNSLDVYHECGML